MALVWDESFVLGIDDIDEQHRSIVEHFQQFSAAVQEGGAHDVLTGMAQFLKEYAQMHFATEERYMLRYNYPHIEEQRREHADFTQDTDELLGKIESEGASRELALALAGKMIRWVIQHVRNHDRQMADFVKGCMEKEQGAV